MTIRELVEKLSKVKNQDGQVRVAITEDVPISDVTYDSVQSELDIAEVLDFESHAILDTKR